MFFGFNNIEQYYGRIFSDGIAAPGSRSTLRQASRRGTSNVSHMERGVPAAPRNGGQVSLVFSGPGIILKEQWVA
jgi:hypothetical protein